MKRIFNTPSIKVEMFNMENIVTTSMGTYGDKAVDPASVTGGSYAVKTVQAGEIVNFTF